MRVSIPKATNVASVRYSVDYRLTAILGKGAIFSTSIPTSHLISGTHHLTASINFRSGRPPTLSKTRLFSVC